MKYLPNPEKSIIHLRDKMAAGKFFVNDYDRKCIDSIIAYHNTTQNEIRIKYKDYYHLFMLIIRYEIVNNRLAEGETLSILEILDKIENALVLPDYEFEQVNLMIEAQGQRELNTDNKYGEFRLDSIMTESQKDKLLELIKSKVDFLILKKATINEK